MSQWVEEEIVLPNGPFAGQRYRHARHPVSKLWFDAIDSGRWSRFAATAPTQNGKTLLCYVCPILYHLFEIGETAVVGLPSMQMANDKWKQDFLPVIEASRYRSLIPTKGEGSRGGSVKTAITFGNGATLRFMTAGGDDKARSGFTSRVVAITEVDGMDESSETSREADKVEQIEGRTRAFGRTGKRVYLECTVSIEKGKIWQELKQGTDSRIVRPCPHCGVYVAPEREHLVGWNDAESEEAAARAAAWSCPACSECWTEDHRTEAAARAVLVHRGQEIAKDGTITGEAPETQTLGFRWSAIDNPFATAASLGAEEWTAAQSLDKENSERKMRQFVWTLPYEPDEVDLTPLDPVEIQARKSGLKQGVCPADTVGIAIGVDTGKHELNWHAIAVGPKGKSVIEYGVQKTEADKRGVHHGLKFALNSLKAYLEKGWQREGGGSVQPTQVWIDSGYHEHTDAIYEFCEDANRGLPEGKVRYRPTKGYGEGQQNNRLGRYAPQTTRSKDVLYCGREYHLQRVRRNGKRLDGIVVVHMNADAWKAELHQSLSLPIEEPGSLTLYEHSEPNGHSDLALQLTAERQIEKFIVGRGTVIVWERVSRQNHQLDAAYGATVAADFIMNNCKASAVAPSQPAMTMAEMAARAKATRERL